MSKKYSDSTFLINSNGDRVFKQVSNTINQLEKDSNGRIIRITNHVDNPDNYKIIEKLLISGQPQTTYICFIKACGIIIIC